MISDSEAMEKDGYTRRYKQPNLKTKRIFISTEAYKDIDYIDQYIRSKKKDCDRLIVEIADQPCREIAVNE